MRCLFCNKDLGFLSKLRNRRFCTEDHRREYQENQQLHAFSTLIERGRDDSYRSDAQQQTENRDESEQTAPAANPETTQSLFAEESPTLSAALPIEEQPSEVASVSDEDDDVRPAESATAGAVSEVGTIDEEEQTKTVSASEAPEHPSEEDKQDGTASGLPIQPVQGSLENMAHHLATLDYDRHYFQEILDRVPIGIAILQDDLTVRYSNQSFRELRGSNGTISDTDVEFRSSIESLTRQLSEGEVDHADEVMESENSGARSSQHLFAVKLPLRDKMNPETLVVVVNSTGTSSVAE